MANHNLILEQNHMLSLRPRQHLVLSHDHNLASSHDHNFELALMHDQDMDMGHIHDLDLDLKHSSGKEFELGNIHDRGLALGQTHEHEMDLGPVHVQNPEEKKLNSKVDIDFEADEDHNDSDNQDSGLADLAMDQNQEISIAPASDMTLQQSQLIVNARILQSQAIVSGLDQQLTVGQEFPDVKDALGEFMVHRVIEKNIPKSHAQLQFPLAFGVVAEENDDNWKWFLSELHTLLETNSEIMPRLTILSDRQKGIVDGVEVNLPTAFHGFCLRYLCDSFQKEFNNTVLVNLLSEAAYALTAVGLGHLTANIVESLNSWILVASGLPIIQMMELAIKLAHGYHVTKANDATFEVTSHHEGWVVDVRSRRCNGWHLSGPPCAHAVAALLSCRQNVHRFTESCSTMATYRKAYSNNPPDSR
ncbi:hypothetical protein FEM48_Zijuj09G0051000 [Ziziphus jujuba var. spinosa]|uniref:MULE transposase domain-containing protein n=1 Tax=Ziziphus jujuba var. spinosa TaxID=714518 RepID=A0A978UR20_ZIZJJ|nr:hypothetical protein FEM48_Zijuj09G0051000 [Ziziphus jujuba var. spinosa]